MVGQEIIRNHLAGRLSAGVHFYSQLALKPGGLLNGYVREQTAAIRRTHDVELPPGFALSRRLYKSFHIDPTKHRPSSEALWRRLRDQNDFPAVNPIVDLTNLLSLKFQVCFGLYDMARLQGPVDITLGDAGDRYQGIRKETMNFDGRIVLRDAQGAFGNPSADSLRASVGESSRDVMQVLFFHPDDPGRQGILDAALADFKSFFTMAESRSFFI